jgi:hypothetical protein
MKIADTYLDNFFHRSTCQANLGSLRNFNHSPGGMFPKFPAATSFSGDLKLSSWRADESAEPVSITNLADSIGAFLPSRHSCLSFRELARRTLLQLSLTLGSLKNNQILPTLPLPSSFFSSRFTLSSTSCTKSKLSNKRLEFAVALTHVLACA